MRVGLVIVTFAAGLAAVVGPPAAHAGPAPAPPSELPDAASAASAAARFHQRVEISSRRTESSQVYANPDGTLTAEESAVPLRARRADGTWAPIDLTLRVGADGSVAPAVTAVPMTLSRGGNEPLATLSYQGQRFGLSWPGTLPAATLAGDTATYAEVLPGVDLRVRAERTGFAEVLVVKTREAARNPKLAQLRFHTSGTQAAVKPGRTSGAADVVDAAGNPVFRMGAPMAWDSAPAVHPDPASAEPSTSDADRPGSGAQRGAMGVQVSGTDLVVTPDPALLSAGTLPLYIDPSVSPLRWHWTMINSTFPNQSYWSYDRASHMKVGFTNDPQNMVYRSIADFDTSAWRGKHVLSAAFSADLVHSWSCSDSTTELHLTGAVDQNTTWNNNAGSWGGSLANISNSSCNDVRKYTEWGGGGVTNVVQQSTGWSSITLGLRASNEGSTSGWKKFDENTPKLTVNFNSYPNVPDTMTVNGKPCTTGANRPWISTLDGADPVFKARLTDPDGADHLTGNFTWVAHDGVARNASQGNIANGGYAQVYPADQDFLPGATYSFKANTADGIDTSAWSGSCEFAVDNAAPDKAPVVTSADGRYPSDGGTSGWHPGVGIAGTFTIDSNGVSDNGVNDVASYLYSTLDPPSTPVAAPSLGAPVTVTVTPTRPGLNTLFARSVDRAGNLGPITAYKFFVQGGTPPVGQWSLADGSGTTASDAGTPGGHPVTLNSGAHWTAGRVQDGSAVNFDGATGEATTTAAVVDTSQSFSVSAWVRLTSTSEYRSVVAQDGATNSGFVLQYRVDQNRWSMSVMADGANVPVITASSYAPPNVGTWTHLVGVYDRPANLIRLYVDGVVEGWASWTTPWNATGPLRIGRLKWAGAVGSPFAGDVSDVRVWQRAITGDEALAIASDGVVSRLGQGGATADSSCTATQTADKAIDGTVLNDSKWCSLGANRWLRTQLSGLHTITDIVVRHSEAGGEPAAWNTRDYDVLSSVDGATWTTALQVRGNTSAVTHSKLPAPVRAAYLKLVVITPTQNTDPAARIYEFEAYGRDDTLTDYAVGQPATGSTPCGPNETPAKAVNGTVSGGIYEKWCSLAAPKWLQVNLGYSRTISWISIRNAGAGGETASWNTRDYNLLVSDDGVTWTTVAQVRGNTADSSGVQLTSPFIAQYVRLDVITPTQNTDSAARIYEFEIYGN